MEDKIIVSNRVALTAKYGAAGLTKSRRLVDALIAADAERGIKSRLVYLDDAAAMKSFTGSAVNDRTSARQNKEAIDAIFRAANPEYLMILGAPDVVPHQDLTNPAYDPPDDPDKFAYGDLPYACDDEVLTRHCDVQGADPRRRTAAGFDQGKQAFASARPDSTLRQSIGRATSRTTASISVCRPIPGASPRR